MNLLITLFLGLLVSGDKVSVGHAMDQMDIVDQMSHEFGVTAYPRWMPCGYENAFYMPISHAIVFCMDNQDGWEQTAAHETAHAVIFQRNLDPGSDPQANERGADELGALWLIEHGKLDAVASGATEYMRWWRNDPVQHDTEHPRSIDRAWELLCLLDGATGGSPECQGFYAFKRAYWANQLRLHPVL